MGSASWIRPPTDWDNVRQVVTARFAELKNEIEAVVLENEHPFWVALRGDLQQQAETLRADLDIHV